MNAAHLLKPRGKTDQIILVLALVALGTALMARASTNGAPQT